MTDTELSATELDDRGRLDDAAAKYARDGCRRLVGAHFEMNLRTRIGIGDLLLSISADRRAGNERRPRYVARIARPLIEEVKETTDDDVLEAVAIEWLGDLDLMLGPLGPGDADARYDEAEAAFDAIDMDWYDERHVDEPDVSFAYYAVWLYSDHRGGELSRRMEDVTVRERLQQKRDLARSLASDADE